MVGGDLPGTSNQVNTKRQGTWADSEVEKALKSILSFAKTYRGKIIKISNTLFYRLYLWVCIFLILHKSQDYYVMNK